MFLSSFRGVYHQKHAPPPGAAAPARCLLALGARSGQQQQQRSGRPAAGWYVMEKKGGGDGGRLEPLLFVFFISPCTALSRFASFPARAASRETLNRAPEKKREKRRSRSAKQRAKEGEQMIALATILYPLDVFSSRSVLTFPHHNTRNRNALRRDQGRVALVLSARSAKGPGFR